MKLIVAVLLMSVATGLAAPKPPAAKVGPGFFIVGDNGFNRAALFNREGVLLWQYKSSRVYDVHLLPSGNVLFTHDGGVTEVTPAKKVAFQYKTKSEVFSCQRLANGNTLIAECTAERILEVDPKGTIVKEIKTQSPSKGHKHMRCARKTAAGTYLVAHLGEQVIKEYDGDGKILKEFKTPWNCYEAHRRANGNTVATGESGMIEFDPDAKVVWERTAKDFGAVNMKWIAGMSIGADGRIVLANWLGHHQEYKGDPIVMLSKDRKVIWSYKDKARQTNKVTGVRHYDALPKAMAAQIKAQGGKDTAPPMKAAAPKTKKPAKNKKKNKDKKTPKAATH
ncbi:MAG: hypothetical protein HN909_03620 [Phycisphaerales bacterium]|jgi:hypothetical protein|nr:hypothetical protein [Phycisphaerales bacterium]